MDNAPQNPNLNPSQDPWQNTKDFALAGISAAFGDPEAMKTVVDVVANMTAKGLSHLPVKDQNKEKIREKISKAVDQGADSLMDVLSLYQKKAVESNTRLREKYGRRHTE
jgi:hypothetical protein